MKIFSEKLSQKDYISGAALGSMFALISVLGNDMADDTMDRYENYAPAEKHAEFTGKAAAEAIQNGFNYYIDGERNVSLQESLTEKMRSAALSPDGKASASMDVAASASFDIDDLNAKADQMMGEFEDKAKAQVEDAKHYKTRYSAMFLCASLLALYSAIGTIVNPKGRAQAANNQVLPKPSL